MINVRPNVTFAKVSALAEYVSTSGSVHLVLWRRAKITIGLFDNNCQWKNGCRHTNINYLLPPLLVIIIILFIERHFQLAVRGALQHIKA